MNKVKAIIIDDEASNRTLIKKLVTELNANFEVLGEAENVKQAYELIKKLKPDVIFLDIKMPDGNGFSLLTKFDQIDFEVVFISGFDNYAMKAFEFNALDFILKPIDSHKLIKTLSKVQIAVEGKSAHSDRIKEIVNSYDLSQMIMTKIPVHAGNQVMLLELNELVSVRAEGGCTYFKTIKNEKYQSSKQISDFDFFYEHLPNFVKINKGICININFITNYSKGEPCFVTLIDNTSFEIPRRKKGEILELINKKSQKP